MSLTSSIEKRSLLGDSVDVVGVGYLTSLFTFLIEQFMNYVQSILLGRIEERGLAVHILVLKVQAAVKKQVQTLFLALPADIEHDGLLVTIFEVRICSVIDQQLHDFIALFVIDQNGCEVEGGLTSLRFETIHNNRVVVLQESIDFIHCAKFTGRVTNT